MLGTLFVVSCFSAACKDRQKNAIILNKSHDSAFARTVVALQTIRHFLIPLFVSELQQQLYFIHFFLAPPVAKLRTTRI